LAQQTDGRASQHPLQSSLSTGRVVKLFVASALLLSGAAGCSNKQDCIDQNRDGYCDNGSGGSGGARSGYYGSSGGSSKSGTSSGISPGSHGGIGSSGSSSS
jgi:hypothetical protein